MSLSTEVAVTIAATVPCAGDRFPWTSRTQHAWIERPESAVGVTVSRPVYVGRQSPPSSGGCIRNSWWGKPTSKSNVRLRTPMGQYITGRT